MSTSAATSTEQTGSYKRSFRNYLLDSRFQLKYTGFLVVGALAIAAVMGGVLYSTTRSMFDESAKVVQESKKAAEESQKAFDESKKVSEVSRMNVKDLAADSPELLAEFNKEADEYDRTMAEKQRQIADQQRQIADQQAMLVASQQKMLAALAGALLLMVFAIGLFGIYFTHKVAGPVYKMKRLLKQVGQGNLRVEARLRKGDELQDFFDAFTQMVAGLREMEKRQLDEVDKAVDAVERGGKDDAKASLGKVREEMKHALDG